MKRKILKEHLLKRISDLEKKSWTIAEVESLPTTNEGQLDGCGIQIELSFLEYLDDKKRAHVCALIDDYGFFTSRFPVSSSFIVDIKG